MLEVQRTSETPTQTLAARKGCAGISISSSRRFKFRQIPFGELASDRRVRVRTETTLELEPYTTGIIRYFYYDRYNTLEIYKLIALKTFKTDISFFQRRASRLETTGVFGKIESSFDRMLQTPPGWAMGYI